MSSKLEPVIWLRDTGHIGIHGGVDGLTYVRTDGRTIDDAKIPQFLVSMAYHIFLTMLQPWTNCVGKCVGTPIPPFNIGKW